MRLVVSNTSKLYGRFQIHGNRMVKINMICKIYSFYWVIYSWNSRKNDKRFMCDCWILIKLREHRRLGHFFSRCNCYVEGSFFGKQNIRGSSKYGMQCLIWVWTFLVLQIEHYLILIRYHYIPDSTYVYIKGLWIVARNSNQHVCKEICVLIINLTFSLFL